MQKSPALIKHYHVHCPESSKGAKIIIIASFLYNYSANYPIEAASKLLLENYAHVKKDMRPLSMTKAID